MLRFRLAANSVDQPRRDLVTGIDLSQMMKDVSKIYGISFWLDSFLGNLKAK
jgi:hypothetical protein